MLSPVWNSMDEDLMDRAVGLWTVTLLVVLAVGVVALPIVVEPTVCFVPAQFEDSQVRYSHQSCDIAHSIPFLEDPPIPVPQKLPFESPQPPQRNLWVVFSFLTMALAIGLPYLLKRQLQSMLGVSTGLLLQTVQSKPQARHELLRDFALMVSDLLARRGCFSTIVYLVTKLLAALSCLACFLFIIVYVKPDLGLREDSALNDQPLPYHSHCFFEIRQMVNVHEYTVQCVHPLNMVLKKLFLFLAYYFLFLVTAIITSIVSWSVSLFVPVVRNIKVSAYLKASRQAAGSHDQQSSLPTDAYLMIHLAACNGGDLLAGDVTLNLWNVFKEKHGGTDKVARSVTYGQESKEFQAEDVPLAEIAQKA